MTEWRPVEGFDGAYLVSDAGEVVSLKGRAPKALRQNTQGTGHYASVSLWRHNREHRYKVHKLVMQAFVGPVPAGYEIAHQDGVRTHNALSNLRYKTRSKNHADKVAHGTHNRGERHPMSRLTERDVLNIRAMIGDGAKRAAVATEFGISLSHLDSITTARSWAWLKA